MTVSYNWLKDYLTFDLQPEEVGKILTSTGLEVEHSEQIEQIPGGLAGVIVAQVVECVPHPDSDHLHITKLYIGQDELLQVVCGAPNVAAGQKVLLATIGTKLPTNDGSEFKIKRSKIRGVESCGMICAEDELGIGTSHDGIMVLEPEAVPGTPAKDYLKLGSDTIYEIGLTPNRIDGASHIGVVRDLYAYLKLHNIPVEFTLPDVSAYSEKPGEAIPVKVLAPDLAPRYIGITIKGAKVGPSPEWLKEKLLAIGQHSINNVVDITNFVMNEMCQPLHAFDASKIKGGEVIVRRSTPECKFVTLDGVERVLTEDDLVICNVVEPMCIAGVFGGLDSGVTEATTDIFLESAYFNPVSIRKTSKRHTLKTDASFRYERGIDPNITMYAAKRAALLIEELTGGVITGKMQESYPVKIERAKVQLNYARMEALIGKNIGTQTIRNILEYMEFEIISENAEGCEVYVPSYRVDVTRECDVVEDVLRIYGYNNIELPTSMKVSINASEHPDPESVRATVSNLLADNGFMEMMNNSLTKSDYYSKLQSFPADKLVMVYNPLSQDLNCMRQTLLLNALEVVAYNINHQSNSLKLFELGNVYSFSPKESAGDSKVVAGDSKMVAGDPKMVAGGDSKLAVGDLKTVAGDPKAVGGDSNMAGGDFKTVAGDPKAAGGDSNMAGGDFKTVVGDPKADLKSYREEMRLSMVITGPETKAWRNELCASSYFSLKGYLELLLKRFGANIYDLQYDAAPSDLFSEGLEYKLQGKRLALAGTIAPARLKEFGIKQPVFAAEINYPVFFELVKRDKVKYKEMPKYPEVRRDLALLLDEKVSFAELRAAAFKTEKNILKQVTLFDVYRGVKILIGKKQYAMSFVLQDPEKTLTDGVVEATINKILKTFEEKFGAVLR